MAHEHQAAAAGALDVLEGGGVGHVAGVEAVALVGDVDLEVLGANHGDDGHLFIAVHLVAVLDGVDERLFEGQADAEDVLVADVVGVQQSLDVVLDAASLGRVAGDHQVHRGVGRWVHEVDRVEVHDPSATFLSGNVRG